MGLFDKLKEKLLPEKTTLLEEIPRAEAWWIENMEHFGYPVDGTMASLAELDRFFDEQKKPGGLLDGKVQAMRNQLFAVGCYVGQVICRELNGTWVTDDKVRGGEALIGVRLPDGRVARPVQRAIRRFEQGGEAWSFVSFGKLVSTPKQAEEPAAPEQEPTEAPMIPEQEQVKESAPAQEPESTEQG